MTYPSCDIHCGKFVDEALNTPYTGLDDVALVIIESEQGEGGYVAPPPEYLQIIKKAAEKCGALYIADEVQSGAGRTGKMWCVEYSGVVPDMLTWGKGMGGDIPMAGVTFRQEINETLEEGSQPGTFAGNAVACMVCMTNIDIITDKEMDLLGRANQLGEEVRDKLREASRNVKVIGDVRGRGLMIGIEVVADPKTKEPLEARKCGEIAIELLNKGIVIVPCGRFGNVFRFMPPLTVPRDLVMRATDIVIDVLKSC
jgi:4-aminobutyrate aminotransferase